MSEAQETSDYPTSLDTFVTLTDKEDLAEASDINKMKAAITAVQTELGLDPAGTQTDLVTRLAKILATSGALRQGTSYPGTTEPGLIFFRTDLDKVYIRNAADNAWDEIGAAIDYNDGTTYTEIEALTERSVNSASFVELKRISPLIREGIVTITFDMNQSTFGSTSNIRLYINSVYETGFEASITDTTTYTSKTFSAVPVSANDVISLWGNTNSGIVYVKNVRVKTTNPTLPVEVSGY